MKFSSLLATVFFVVLAVSFISFKAPIVHASVTMHRTFNSLNWDGTIYNQGSDWNTTHDSTSGTVMNTDPTMTVGVGNLALGNYSFRAVVGFDTGVIAQPATFINATLRLKVTSIAYTNIGNITILEGLPMYPHVSPVSTDFDWTLYKDNPYCGTLNASSTVAETYFNITLNSHGLESIVKAGTTKFMLMSSQDLASEMQPLLNMNVTNFYTAEAAEAKSPKLDVWYETTSSYTFHLQGAYDETGVRNGAINCTFNRPEQSPLTFELDGEYNATSEANHRMVFKFDCGYNISRTYYVYDYYEDIWVFKPASPFLTYYFNVMDFVGVTNAYLESYINIDGQERIVERQRLDNKLNVAFVWVMDASYRMRLVCDQGTHEYGIYTAGAVPSFTVSISSEFFPDLYTGYGNVTVTGYRDTYNNVTLVYSDLENNTRWVYFEVHSYQPEATVYYYNYTLTGSSRYGNRTFTYDKCAEVMDYYVLVKAGHDDRGTLTFVRTFPANWVSPNPWENLSVLGYGLPFLTSQIFGFMITAFAFAVGNAKNLASSILLGLLVASAMIAIGWLNISWGWMAIVFFIAIVGIIAVHKERTPQ